MIDYTPRYPDTVFANALWSFRPLLDAAVADAGAGNPTGKNYTPLSLMKDGGNDISYVEGVAPAEAVARMEEVRAAIMAGEFEVPRNFDEPA